MFRRRKPEKIWVTLEGLGRLIEDLNRDVDMNEFVNGTWIQVRTGDHAGLYLVTLVPHLADRLRERVLRYEFSDVYGPRN